MAAINVLVVVDGQSYNPVGTSQPNDPNQPWPKHGFSLVDRNTVPTSPDPQQNQTDRYFTVTEFVWLLQNASAPSINVETAHRRIDFPNTTATYTGFAFTPASIAKYHVLCLLGYEGYNGSKNFGGKYEPVLPSELADSELEAIIEFMNAGGGVFATGDHMGLGSFMCGRIPRVRSMRKWWAGTDAQTDPFFPGGDVPTVGIDYTGKNAVDMGNWPGGGDRADTLVKNTTAVSFADTDQQFYFDDQSDDIPMKLFAPPDGSKVLNDPTLDPGVVHPILRGSNGPIYRYPDHMHEGEVVTPSNKDAGALINGKTYTEYPTYPTSGGFQPLPAVLATGKVTGGHDTATTDGISCEQTNFTNDINDPTNDHTIGILCAYDGRAANVGRIVTDSSFHHYLDLNLIGDPCGSSPDRQAGFSVGGLRGPVQPGGVLDDLQQFYVNTVTWLAKPNPNFYFVIDKSTFSRDEASASRGQPSPSFWLVVDGHTVNDVNTAVSTVTWSGPFAPSATNGIQKPQQSAPLVTQGQRVLIPYSVQFSNLNAFPPKPLPGQLPQPVEMPLYASITVAGTDYLAEATFELLSGADPSFQNINPNVNNPFYLSQDLSVFSAVGGQSVTLMDGTTQVPFTTSGPNPAQTFMQNLLKQMDLTSGHASGTDDPFKHFPTTTANDGDSSVRPTVNGATNYNFAVARVRNNGTSDANLVRVFFRLFLTQTNDTDYQPTTSYASSPDPKALPGEPQPAPDGSSTPFYATGSANGDYNQGGVGQGGANVKTIPAGESRYFGCFLDVYSPPWDWSANARGSHHCLVAEIASDDAPIINSGGITVSPNTSDKLAQRNLQLTPAGG
jgi:hypothetical protein